MEKWIWIIAGPNGAGKSTFTNEFLKTLGHGDLKKLNADERTATLRADFPNAAQDDLNLRAAVEIDQEVEACIRAGQSFVVETVLSSPKYRDDILTAKASGFTLGLIYISLFPPELSPLRVGERVEKGGHDVDPAKAVQRYHRSHEQLRWFAPQADLLMVFDNSDPNGIPILLASRLSGSPLNLIQPGINPSVDHALAEMPRWNMPPGGGT